MTPTEIVQAQLDAYNARDIEAFAACYAPGIVVRELATDVVRCTGITEFTRLYREQFSRWPDQRATIVSRQIAGEMVIDTEFVTGVPDRPDAHVLGIYLVREQRIQRVWFSPRF